MKRKDFWHSPEAESMGAVPTGTKAGQFLFLSAQRSIDLDTGEIIRDLVDLPQELRDRLATSHHLVNAYFGPIIAQTWTIYQNLSKILAKQGASLEDIVRQRLFLRDISDVGWMEKVMLSFYPKEKPVTLILGVPDRGVHEDVRVWVDAIALIPKKGGLNKEAVYVPELKKVTEPYPQAVKVGQFLFFDGIKAVDLKTGHPVNNFDEVDPEARSEVEGMYIDASARPVKCQYWLTYSHIRQLLESQGAVLTNLLDATDFRRHGMKAFGEREYLREKLFGKAQSAPAQTGLGISNLCVIPDVEVITGGVALLPGEHHKQSFRYGKADRAGTYPAMTKCEPFWFFSGTPDVDFTRQQTINSFNDILDNGRFLAQNYISDNQTMMAKAWYIYNNMIDNVEAKASQVIHQTVYLVDTSDWLAVERVANVVFNGNIPPTTIVPVDDVAFYWQYQGTTQKSIRKAKIEIQFWGLTE